MSSSFLAKLNGWAVAPEDIRQEPPEGPTVGDLIKPGAVIRTNYGTGPYLIDSVTRHEALPGIFAWTISGHHRAWADGGQTGPFLREERNRGWISDLVADTEGGVPVVVALFRCNDDRVMIDAEPAFAESRAGQGALF